MNQQGPVVIPPPRKRRSYPTELRERIIYQNVILGYKAQDISIQLDIDLRTVYRVLQLWGETGEVVPVSTGKHARRARLMGTHQHEFLLALVERHPDLYLDEMQEHLYRQHRVIVGLSTIWRTLTELGLRRKRVHRIAAERNERDRLRYMYTISEELPERLVFVDESSLDLRTTFRLFGWSMKGHGKRSSIQAKFQRGKRYSILPALTSKCILHVDVREGAYDGNAFVAFIQELLPMMNLWPAENSVLVMDNCRIHHHPDVQALCDERGVRLRYLPAYSPDLNPIEEAFSWFKSYIRRHGTAFRGAVESDGEDGVVAWVYRALGTIEACQIYGWMKHSGYC